MRSRIPIRCELPRTRRWRLAAVPMLAAFTVASGGCSLVYTRGPQPSASSSTSQPEPCTSTNGYAIADTVLAAVFFTALAGGTVALIDSL